MSSILCRLETLAEKRADKDKGAAGDALRVFAATRGLDSLTVMTVGFALLAKPVAVDVMAGRRINY